MSKRTKKNRKEDNFEVYLKSDVTDNKDNKATIITSQLLTKKVFDSALQNYDPSNRIYSSYLSCDDNMGKVVSMDLLNNLAINPQSNLKDIQTINSIVRQYINKDDIIGKTYETVESNVNTSYKLSYENVISKVNEHRNKNRELDNVKKLIKTFNNKINLKELIRNIVPTVFAEGNYCMYLRHNDNNYTIDYYPLGVCAVSDYTVNGEPYLIIDVQQLITKLCKTRLMNQDKPLFFNSLDDEIKSTYPDEVYQAYKNKDRYAKLDIRYSGCVRINNMNRKYGLTPIYRALKPALMLENFDHTDLINSKARSKKIIHQKLREKLMGESGQNKGLDAMAYAHSNFMKAWKSPTVVVTTPPFVESISYVEPQVEDVNADIIKQYRSREMVALGIVFLMPDKGQTVTTASISVKELIKTVDKITEQISDVINKWYRVIVQDNGYDVEYAPILHINSSEELSLDMKKDLAEFMFCKLGCSYETAFDIMGTDINDEKQKRIRENADGYSNIFLPHPTAFNVSDSADTKNPNGNIGGRPQNEEPNDKQDYDKQRNNNKK